MYVDSLIGADTVNTMPEATLLAFMEHGAVADTLEEDVEGAEQLIEDLESAGVSMEQVTAGLLADGVRQFTESFDQLTQFALSFEPLIMGGRDFGTATGTIRQGRRALVFRFSETDPTWIYVEIPLVISMEDGFQIGTTAILWFMLDEVAGTMSLHQIVSYSLASETVNHFLRDLGLSPSEWGWRD